MAPKRVYTYEVRVPVGPGQMHLGGFLDMLRYDGAVVTKWDRETTERGYVYAIRLESTTYTPGRWESMGLYPKETI